LNAKFGAKVMMFVAARQSWRRIRRGTTSVPIWGQSDPQQSISNHQSLNQQW
jgi:hypothetical protein